MTGAVVKLMQLVIFLVTDSARIYRTVSLGAKGEAQVALQGVIEGVTSLIQCHLDSLHTQVCHQLRSADTPETV